MLVTATVVCAAAVITLMAGFIVSLFRRGLNEGRLTEILSTLQTIASDHESRIRTLEHQTWERKNNGSA